MKLVHKLERMLRQYDRPLDYIEAVVASVIMISLLIMVSHMGSRVGELGPVMQLLISEGLVWFLIIVLVPTLIVHIYAYFCALPSRSYKLRSMVLFIYTMMYLFLSVLAYFHYSAASLVWIQTVSLALITGIVYLHVRVHLRNGKQR